MATLNGATDFKLIKFEDIPATNQVAGIWTVTLQTSTDFLVNVVPTLETTSSICSLTSGITAVAGAAGGGFNTIQITGGSDGQDLTFVTLHRKGNSNHLSLDEAP
jgi:hypothetical protein